MAKYELPKTYEAALYEDKLYQHWESEGYFKPWRTEEASYPQQAPFTVMMPPPNATGTLHVGHAMFLTLQDIMVRFQRLRGVPTLWLPGTDHAAVATQTKVEGIIRKTEGKSRHDIGKDELLRRIHAFIADSQDTIRTQVRKMGASCDWSRERYTLEDSLSRAVRKIFVDMYRDGLIYRGKKIINWCPASETTLSNEEVIAKEVQGHLYYFTYPIKDSDEVIVVATTRPETMLGDTAVAVHPEDKRYQHLIGKFVSLPLSDREIPIIADDYVDQTFGSGAVKITPGHDPNDFAIGQRHQLEVITILDTKGAINALGGKYQGLDRFVARKQIVKDMEDLGLLIKIEDKLQNIGFSERGNVIVEPMVSLQWFIATTKAFRDGQSIQSMCQDVIKNGEIKIIPERFEKNYFNWVDNLQDWCISRQIWFGHQIPAWYCDDCNQITVQIDAPKQCEHCHSTNIRQDEDNLDTWFSSGLWTFSTLGWPEKTKELEYFHPTSVLETGYDILTFWVLRMIMMSKYALNEIPFKTVYLHGLVRDEHGNKMSKSLGNIIDPLDMIAKYGTDAVRLSLSLGTTPGNDIRISETKIASYRNFINKIWNVSRFILSRIDTDITLEVKAISISDAYILSRLQRVIGDVTKYLTNYQFSEAGTMLYDFLWHDLADWYIEISKVEGKENQGVLMHVLSTLLQLLHPFIPFVTEQIWSYIHPNQPLIISEWPQINDQFIDSKAEQQFELIRSLITTIRTKRAELKIDPVKKIPATIISDTHFDLLQIKMPVISFLARLTPISIQTNKETIQGPQLSFLSDGIEVILHLENIIDIEAEKAKTMTQIGNLEKQIDIVSTKLANEGFVAKAPAKIIEEEKARLEAMQLEKVSLEEKLRVFAAQS